MFVGRTAELAKLGRLLERVRRQHAGVLVAVRGRRQVGKSRLVERFLDGVDVPAAFFAASRGARPADERAAFAETVAQSGLDPGRRLDALAFGDWRSLLTMLADLVTEPAIVVIDELPWLLENDPALEGVLQSIWDRRLSRTPLLLVMIGSAVTLMEALASHGRPLFGRAQELVVEPLTVADTATLLSADALAAFDAQLLTGGFPRLVAEWQPGQSAADFLRQQLADATSPLVVLGERALNAEFPVGLQAREVLIAIGAGEAGFSRLRDRSGLNQGSLARTLQTLTAAGAVAAERPLSARPSRLVRYRVADAYLRFWLRFVLPDFERVLRGRGDLVAEALLAAWADYRGSAVEPLVRASVERLLPAEDFGAARAVGGWWDRSRQVDLVGADRPHPPATVAFLGTVKWRSRRPLGRDDVMALAAERQRVSGAESARLVGVSAAGFARPDLDIALGPADLVDAWR